MPCAVCARARLFEARAVYSYNGVGICSECLDVSLGSTGTRRGRSVLGRLVRFAIELGGLAGMMAGAPPWQVAWAK